MIFLSFASNDIFMFREHLESSHFQKVYVPTLWLFPSSSESVATLPPFGPIEGQKWFDQISSQWASQKPVCIDLFRQNPVFTSLHLKYPVRVVPPQIFHSDIYTILMKVQTCEKLGRPHCGFFPAAQIFHSDIYTTLMKVRFCISKYKSVSSSMEMF